MGRLINISRPRYIFATQSRNQNNTFLPMRNRFAYSCSVKICLTFIELWKVFSVPRSLWKYLPCTVLSRCLEKYCVFFCFVVERTEPVEYRLQQCPLLSIASVTVVLLDAESCCGSRRCRPQTIGQLTLGCALKLQWLTMPQTISDRALGSWPWGALWSCSGHTPFVPQATVRTRSGSLLHRRREDSAYLAAVRGSVTLSWSLSAADSGHGAGHGARHLQGPPLPSEASSPSTALHFLAVPGPDELLMLSMISAALWPGLYSNKKTSHLPLFNISSIV